MNRRESPGDQCEDSGVIQALEEVFPFARIQGVINTTHRQEENRTDREGQATDSPVPAALAELPEKPGKIKYDGNKQPMGKGGNGFVHFRKLHPPILAKKSNALKRDIGCQS